MRSGTTGVHDRGGVSRHLEGGGVAEAGSPAVVLHRKQLHAHRIASKLHRQPRLPRMTWAARSTASSATPCPHRISPASALTA